MKNLRIILHPHLTCRLGHELNFESHHAVTRVSTYVRFVSLRHEITLQIFCRQIMNQVWYVLDCVYLVRCNVQYILALNTTAQKLVCLRECAEVESDTRNMKQNVSRENCLTDFVVEDEFWFGVNAVVFHVVIIPIM